MSHALATPRAFLFIGRLADLAALTAASPPYALVFAPGAIASADERAQRQEKRKSVSRGGAEDGGGVHTRDFRSPGPASP